MFAVDTSKSMRAHRPASRSAHPREAGRRATCCASFPASGSGLIAFAGDAFVQAPMTIDQAVFGEALDALDTSIIARGGTDIASPIRAAVEAMATRARPAQAAGDPQRRRGSPGRGPGGGEGGGPRGAGDLHRRRRDARGGLIPIAGTMAAGPLRDDAGQPVRSHLDEQTAREHRASHRGRLRRPGPGRAGLETLYRAAPGPASSPHRRGAHAQGLHRALSDPAGGGARVPAARAGSRRTSSGARGRA